MMFLTAAYACPGSGSPIHAGANMNVQFTNSCAEVAEEITARASARVQGVQWQDPHNHGEYTLEQSSANYIKVKRQTKNHQFTDRADFTLTDNGTGCSVAMCSESQGISAADSGTNICNLYSLYCNSQDCAGGTCCKVLKNELNAQMGKQTCYPFFFNCPGGDDKTAQTCLKMPSTEETRLELQENAIMLQRMGAFLDAPLEDEEESAF